MRSWNDFYHQTATRAPSALLSKALDLAPEWTSAPWAIDLGCGAGNETRQLLDAGWHVLAIDKEPGAIALTTATCPAEKHGRLTTALASFEQMPPLPRSGLIHAGLSLPFCWPGHFSLLWDHIRCALIPGGVFVGHFFGVRHGWSALENLTLHTEQDIRRLCGGMEIALLRETETLIERDDGPLNWHRFDLIVRNPETIAVTR